MQMKNALLIAVAAAAMLGAVPASAAESALGRISYIYPDGHRLILDAQKTYALAPGVDSKAIGAAEFVRLSLGSGDSSRPRFTRGRRHAQFPAGRL